MQTDTRLRCVYGEECQGKENLRKEYFMIARRGGRWIL